MKRLMFVAVVIGFLILEDSAVLSFNVSTHEAINETVAKGQFDSFSLDLYLKDQLGLQKGINEFFDEKEAFISIRNGGRFEDEPPGGLPYLRSVNHFHNPLTDQGFSGIWGTGFLSGRSSAQWGLLPKGTQSPGGYYSWNDVREYFFEALTASDKTARDKNFSDTFRGLGQLMHLVQDASVPAHSRDDGHYIFFNYEKWSETKVNGQLPGYGFMPFGGTINDIASFIDTNQYGGTNPGVAVGNVIGISEYSNANFFSDDTIGNANFSYPRLDRASRTTANFIRSSGEPYDREYYLKIQDGETKGGQGYLLAAVDWIDYYRQKYPLLSSPLPQIPILDTNVYDDYAKLLIPRAVGYSAGLLNYFFRGKIEGKDVTFDTENRISLKVINLTGNEEAGSGSLTLVAQYRLAGSEDEIFNVSDPLSITGLPRTEDGDSFPFSFPQPIPSDAQNIRLTVVFRGLLGAEEGAVIARKFDPDFNYVFIIQEYATLTGSSMTQDLHCAGYDCPQTSPYYRLEARDGVSRSWDLSQQILTGRFVTYGEMKRIEVSFGKLFINGQEMPDGNWQGGDTPEPPQTWRVELAGSYGGFRELKVILKDNSVFILGLTYYIYLGQEGYKQQTSNPQLPGGQQVFSYSSAQMNVYSGYWLTPDLFVSYYDQWELVQLSGYGLGADSGDSRREIIKNETTGGYAAHFYRTSLTIRMESYVQESAFLCDPCMDYQYVGDLYAKLPVPDSMPLTVTGLYRRIYTQEELDALSALEIQPEYYDLVFD
ncbi:MAG: hypothetical protein AABY46_01325 [Nitrospirota bacterium]